MSPGRLRKLKEVICKTFGTKLNLTKNSCSQLWTFGICSLRSRECGLYKASDILLGDRLCEKSKTVQWIDVIFRSKEISKAKELYKLEDLKKIVTDSAEIFEDNLNDKFYPNRPHDNVCLYNFVQN